MALIVAAQKIEESENFILYKYWNTDLGEDAWGELSLDRENRKASIVRPAPGESEDGRLCYAAQYAIRKRWDEFGEVPDLAIFFS